MKPKLNKLPCFFYEKQNKPFFLLKTSQNPFQPNYPIFVDKQNKNRFLIILIVFCRAKLTNRSLLFLCKAK